MYLVRRTTTGFTIVEIMVALGIAVFMVTIAAGFVLYGFRATTFNSEQETAVVVARRSIDDMSKIIKEARRSERGDYPLAIAAAQNFTFYADSDNDGSAEKINYILNGSVLQKTITQPGADNTYSGSGVTTNIASYITNNADPVFTYFDGSNIQTAAINAIRLVHIELRVNVTPEIAPKDYTVITDVNLRNLKDNL